MAEQRPIDTNCVPLRTQADDDPVENAVDGADLELEQTAPLHVVIREYLLIERTTQEMYASSRAVRFA